MPRGPGSQLGFDAAPRAYSVTELTRDIKLLLESRFTGVWVQGQLSNVKRPSSGHLYFTLKDESAQLPAVMFRSAARRLRFRPDDGTEVLVWGPLTVYEPRGSYQLRVERMEPRGKGALQIAFEQLKAKLAAEGLFAPGRKRPLPLLPRRLGVVTSPTGAALRDFCRILHRRFPNLEVVVYPAQVQGELAAADIAQGVRVLNRLGGFDAIVLARGGGSLEDLWPFNEESVARAVAASTIPVVSAVGHEVDFTIADMVADVRAPTPSAAAEMVVQRKDDVRERVSQLQGRLDKALAFRLHELGARVEQLAAHKGFAALGNGIRTRSQRTDELVFRATTLVGRRLSVSRRRIEELARRLDQQRVDERLRKTSVRLTSLRGRLDAAERAARGRGQRALGAVAAKLHALSPLGVLGRGYSLAWTDRGKLLRRAADASVGDALRLKLHRGELDCRVERTRDDTE